MKRFPRLENNYAKYYFEQFKVHLVNLVLLLLDHIIYVFSSFFWNLNVRVCTLGLWIKEGLSNPIYKYNWRHLTFRWAPLRALMGEILKKAKHHFYLALTHARFLIGLKVQRANTTATITEKLSNENHQKRTNCIAYPANTRSDNWESGRMVGGW